MKLSKSSKSSKKSKYVKRKTQSRKKGMKPSYRTNGRSFRSNKCYDLKTKSLKKFKKPISGGAKNHPVLKNNNNKQLVKKIYH